MDLRDVHIPNANHSVSLNIETTSQRNSTVANYIEFKSYPGR